MSWPDNRTGTLSSSREPTASSSPKAQSIPPSLAIAARRSSTRFSRGWTVKSSGRSTKELPIRLTTSSGTAVSIGPSSGCSMAGSALKPPVALRVSTKTFSSCSWKSLSASSASAMVMSPRPISASV